MLTRARADNICWRAPSNIALIKYWGKKHRQIPMNPSLSMTLEKCFTETQLLSSSHNEFEVEFYLEGERQPEFEKKISKYIQDIDDLYPELQKRKYKIYSKNSFPHSAGIASSASGFAALSLCLLELSYSLKDEDIDASFFEKASFLARLGSGSACRSIQGSFNLWGELNERGSHKYSLDITEDVHSSFSKMKNAICIVDSAQKQISSRVGHSLMHGHPFKEARVQLAKDNAKIMIDALHSQDMLTFGTVLENEALTLHGLMLSSDPSFVLLKPNSLEIISKVRDFRKKSSENIFFTIDAGPNIHILYFETPSVLEFIKKEISPYCENIIYDQCGSGAKAIYE
jgi:diphosphomevalonate decarboxylase